MHVLTPAPSGPSPFTYWRRLPVGTDSITIGTPMALGGAELRLALEGRALRGTLTTFTDVAYSDRASDATVPIVLEPIGCPSQ